MSQAGQARSSSGGGSTYVFPPVQTIEDFDDFTGADPEQYGGKLGWRFQGDFESGANTTGNPGIVTFAADPGGQQNSYLGMNVDASTQGPFLLGGGNLDINFVANLGTIGSFANDYTAVIGLTDVNPSAPVLPTNGCYLQYNYAVNGGRWQLINNDGGVSTAVDTGISAVVGYVNYSIRVNAAATSISARINGVSVGTNTANIPLSNNLSPSIYVEAVDPANMPPWSVDLFYYVQALTVPRPS